MAGGSKPPHEIPFIKTPPLPQINMSSLSMANLSMWLKPVHIDTKWARLWGWACMCIMGSSPCPPISTSSLAVWTHFLKVESLYLFPFIIVLQCVYLPWLLLLQALTTFLLAFPCNPWPPALCPFGDLLLQRSTYFDHLLLLHASTYFPCVLLLRVYLIQCVMVL